LNNRVGVELDGSGKEAARQDRATGQWAEDGPAAVRFVLAVALVVGGVIGLIWPSLNGMFFPEFDISAATSRILGAAILVGAAIVWFMPSSSKQ
jgi:hypothetical protein